MHFLKIILILFFLGSPLLAQENSLPSPAEAKAQFEKADAELNQTWENLKKTFSPATFSALQEKQREWVLFRDSLALSPSYSGAPADEAKARKSPEYFVTAAALTDSRNLWLKGLNKPLLDESLTGKWSDSYGGILEIVQQNGKIFFNIEVVRGPTAHTGGIDGSAVWNSPLGWYSDQGSEPGKTDVTNLAFHLKDSLLEVMEANTGYYAGARSYFGGSYVCIASLTDEEKKKVLHQSKMR